MALPWVTAWLARMEMMVARAPSSAVAIGALPSVIDLMNSARAYQREELGSPMPSLSLPCSASLVAPAIRVIPSSLWNC